MDTKAFRDLIVRLTGTPIKESSPDETKKNDALLRSVIADERELDCSQFNELLLLLNKDRVEPAFYHKFFPDRALVRDLAQGVTEFQKIAMLRYGNFVHAYRKLSRMTSAAALDRELGQIPTGARDVASSFLSRSPKLLDVEHIPREDTPLVGYLYITQLDREEKIAKVLLAAAKDLDSATDWEKYTSRVTRSLQSPLNNAARGVISAFRLQRELATVQDLHAFVQGTLPKILARVNRGVEVQKTAAKNQDIYLTWDHMDVYFATSMRKAWEFHDLYDFIHGLMNSTDLADLRLRYFDPTQCFTKVPTDKGLVECLMLKRARCTVYSVQDTDTLGKDSELAATLAQGKPVIAYVPEINETQRSQKLFDEELSAILERLRFVLYADDNFMAETSQDDYKFVEDYRELHTRVLRTPFRSITNDTGGTFRSAERENLERLCRVIAASEKRIYDKRADTLRRSHPLALQVNLDTGVANGVLVVRKIDDCARLLRSVLARSMSFEISDDSNMWCLRERISGCIFRVATKSKKIDNCFWNFYLRDDSSD